MDPEYYHEKLRRTIERLMERIARDEIERKEIYATTKWRKLRLSYLMDHPLCERC